MNIETKLDKYLTEQIGDVFLEDFHQAIDDCQYELIKMARYKYDSIDDAFDSLSVIFIDLLDSFNDRDAANCSLVIENIRNKWSKQ